MQDASLAKYIILRHSNFAQISTNSYPCILEYVFKIVTSIDKTLAQLPVEELRGAFGRITNIKTLPAKVEGEVLKIIIFRILELKEVLPPPKPTTKPTTKPIVKLTTKHATTITPNPITIKREILF